MAGHLTVQSDEAIALAHELLALTGESLDDAVTASLRVRLEQERRRHRELTDMIEATDAFAEYLENPPPDSDHSWLYDDETGLPA